MKGSDRNFEMSTGNAILRGGGWTKKCYARPDLPLCEMANAAASGDIWASNRGMCTVAIDPKSKVTLESDQVVAALAQDGAAGASCAEPRKLGLPRLRFEKTDRVLCLVGEDEWAPGSIAALYEDHPEDPTGLTKLPYIVKLDPPIGRLICVPIDDNDCCAAEVCFGQRAEALWWTLYCLPLHQGTQRRFGVGDRVACAVEDESDDFSDWAAGTITEVDISLEADAKRLLPYRQATRGVGIGSASRVPYRVQLDRGCRVIVHRDEHWLVRDLSLQSEGPRQASGGARRLARIETRQRSDGVWEKVDHQTRKVRAIAAGPSS